MNQKETLMTRGAEYGDFTQQASMSQRIEDILREGHGWQNMTHFEREAIKMIAHKMARLANGNPHSVDGWHDIGGYAKLVEDRLTIGGTPTGQYVSKESQGAALAECTATAVTSRLRPEGY
ncbi:hypothetical protein [Stenotrophomonas phage BUCT555]|nr:hypothetical protein [Stenotrophomonas phage BUCT555]